MRSEAERTGLLRKAFQVCTPANAQVSGAGTQFCEERPSAQPVEDFRILPAVRTGRSENRVSRPIPLGAGFQRRGRSPRPNPREGFPKGRAAARPFVSFQGGAGGNRNPPAFLFRGPGGHSLFKREYPPGFSVPKRYSSAGNPGNLFGKTKRKWGFNPVRHSRTSPYQSGAFDVSKENVGCILRGKAALPAANRRLFTDHPGSAACSCTGGRPGPGSVPRWGWRGYGCPPPPGSGW